MGRGPKVRIPVWKTATTATFRRRRRYRTAGLSVAALATLLVCLCAYKWNWWRSLLDGSVVAIPTIVGFVAWVMPIKQATPFHRFWLFVGGFTFSCLVGLQQWETSVAHAREMAQLPTKADFAKLPAAIALEFRKGQTKEILPTGTSVAPALRGKPKKAPSTAPTTDVPSKGAAPNSKDDITKGLDEIKKMIEGQRWGLTADQLVVLAQRMAPYASTFNGWSSSGGDLLTAVLGNPDSTKFAISLVAALRSVGWNLPGSGFAQAVFGGNPEGIIIQLHSREDANTPILNQLLGTLKEAGIQVHGELQDSIPPTQFRIIIGARP